MTASVSVVVPVYNTPKKWLQPCWEHIFCQTLKDYELILVDDGSTEEETRNYLQDILASDPRAKLIRRDRRGGVGPARNAGLEACSCDLVAVQDSDDLMALNRLEIQKAFLDRHPEVSAVGGQAETFSDGQADLSWPTSLPAWPTWESVCEQAAREGRVWFFTHGTVMYRLSYLFLIGGYANRKVGCDLELGLQLLSAGFGFANLPDVVLRIRRHPGSVSASLSEQRAAQEELIRRYVKESPS